MFHTFDSFFLSLLGGEYPIESLPTRVVSAQSTTQDPKNCLGLGAEYLIFLGYHVPGNLTKNSVYTLKTIYGVRWHEGIEGNLTRFIMSQERWKYKYILLSANFLVFIE